MKNIDDVNVSKFSYVNKDFASIYPELLDLAGKLTTKWHPANSNESDPGVVLLKEGAFMSDHLNYNSDKNILEGFLPTATQESSVRNLVEMGGYLPNYYISAEGKISITYKYSDEDKTIIGDNIVVIPAFNINITDSEGQYSYIQTENLSIDPITGEGTCAFKEGYINDLVINDSTLITLDNLDDNHRLYFSKSNIAQNGVFVRNASTDTTNYSWWERVDYLNTKPKGSLVYDIGYDSDMKSAYIEFPSDINEIIGEGLNIKYIVTNGINGNVAANKLNTIESFAGGEITGISGLKLTADKLYCNNPQAITNGKDPETIDEMYKNFKKVVGTFDTLVTCQDYTNAINMMVDERDSKVVSNAVVTDSTNDYNNSIDIVSYDDYGDYISTAQIYSGVLGNYKINTSAPTPPSAGDVWISGGKLYLGIGDNKSTEIKSFKDFVRNTELMSTTDLKLCALVPFSMSNYSTDKPSQAIEKSYEPMVNKSDKLTSIKDSLNDYKCISTSFKDKLPEELYYFKVKTPLKIQVTTYDKISTSAEFEGIQNNIYKVLSEKYNASMLEFGENLNLDDIYQEVLNADERIKAIYISEDTENIETTGVICKDDTSTKDIPIFKAETSDEKYKFIDTTGVSLLLDLTAKNILAGRLCLFEFNNDFKYLYGQAEVSITDNKILNVYTDSKITIPGSTTTVTTLPRENQYIYIAYPNYSDGSIFSTYCYYFFTDTRTVTETEKCIPANVDYTLKAGQQLTCYYKKDGNYISKIFDEGSVINSTFNVTPSSDNDITTTIDGKKCKIITSGNIIKSRVLLETEFSNKTLPCYWIKNNSGNTLFEYTVSTISSTPTISTLGNTFGDGNYISTVLSNNEYFIYTNSDRSGMAVFSAGTKLSITKELALDMNGKWSLNPDSYLSIDDLTSGVDFEYYNLNLNKESYKLFITEMSLVTITKDDKIKITSSDGTSKIINRNWQLFDDTKEINLTLSSDGSSLKINSEKGVVMRTDRIITDTDYYFNGTVTSTPTYTDNFVYNSDTTADQTETTVSGKYVKGNISLTGLNSDGIYISKSIDKFKLESYVDRSIKVGSTTVSLLQEEFSHTMIPGTSNTVELPISYYTTVSDENFATEVEKGKTLIENRLVPNQRYILPITFDKTPNTTGATLTLNIASTSSAVNLNIYDIEDYGIMTGATPGSTPPSTTTYNFNSKDSNTFMLTFDPTSLAKPHVSQDLSVKFNYNLPRSENGAEAIKVTFNPIKVFKGLNSDLSGVSTSTDGLTDMIGYMKKLVNTSSKPNTKINYLNEPENSMAIQDPRAIVEGKFNTDFIYDKNNIANKLALPMVDIDKSDVYLTKSMKGYRD